ncbi:MAG: rhomboid family intramembrane serine protease, partial [Planctomycetota bacterium]
FLAKGCHGVRRKDASFDSPLLIVTRMGLYDRDYGRDSAETPWDRHMRSQSPKSMTIILVVITVAVFLVDMVTGTTDKNGIPDSVLVPWFGCWKETLLKPWMYFQFLTYGFLHAQENLTHVGFNMFGLFIFGRAVEQKIGGQEFLKFYLLSILAGGIVGCLTYWVMGVPLGVVIGASGGVMAVTILFACYYPNTNILLMMVFPVKAWIVATIFVVYNLYGSLSMLTGADRGNTAFTVHLAGIAFAFLYVKLGWSFSRLDFSGYQKSIERSVRRTKLKLHDPDTKLHKENQEVDQILAKIHASGEQSLTRAERRTLEAHSRRQREKRNRP